MLALVIVQYQRQTTQRGKLQPAWIRSSSEAPIESGYEIEPESTLLALVFAG